MLLSSQLPFFGEKRNHVVKQILSGYVLIPTAHKIVGKDLVGLVR